MIKIGISVASVSAKSGQAVPEILPTGITLSHSFISGESGTQMQLTATVTPANCTDKSVVFNVEDASIAVIDQFGLVTFVAGGTTRISATDSQGHVAHCDVQVTQAIIPATSVTLDYESLSGNPGGTQQLIATVLPANATDKSVTFSSSNPSIATVHATTGLVIFVAVGEANIVVTDSAGNTDGCIVSVSAVIVLPTSVSLNYETVNGDVGSTLQLIATVLPTNATNKNVTYVSSNPAYVSVNETTGLLTFVAPGSAIITVTDSEGHTDTCQATAQAVVIPATSVSLDYSSISGAPGSTQQLTATVLPSNATDKSVTFASNNPSIATVHPTTGLVTFVADGNTYVTVTDSAGHTAQCTVAVSSSMEIIASNIVLNRFSQVILASALTVKLTATVTPATADQTVVWSSSDTAKMTVDQTGLVTCVAGGEAAIIATDSEGHKYSCTIDFASAVQAATGIVMLEDTTYRNTAYGLTANVRIGGDSLIMRAAVAPADVTAPVVTWTPADAKVTVENLGMIGNVSVCRITGVTAGTCVLTAACNGFSATVTVVVVSSAVACTALYATVNGGKLYNPVNFEHVSRVKTIELLPGRSKQLRWTIYPTNCTTKNVVLSSSDTGVVYIDSEGLITAVAASGSATITITCGTIVEQITVNIVSAAIATTIITNADLGAPMVAPFALHVDASESDATATINPFHDVLWKWNFGDSDETFTYGQYTGAENNNKNVQRGAVAGHLYRNAGTYTVTMTAYDGTNTVTKSFQVTIQNQDTYYAGLLTACISTSGNFTGAPAGALQFTSSDFVAAITTVYAAGARRFLFCRGESFTYSAAYFTTSRNNCCFGAYGTGNKPIVAPTATNIVLFSYNANSPSPGDNCIFQNLDYNGGGFLTGGFVRTNGRMMRVVDCISRNGPGNYLGGSYNAWCGNYVPSLLGGSGILPLYLAASFGFFGQDNYHCNTFNGEHSLRMQGQIKSVTNHFTFTQTALDKHAWTLRGNVGFISRYNVCSDCLIDLTTNAGVDWAVTIAPTNSSSYERIWDTLFERNCINVADVAVGIQVIAERTSIRNNLFIMSGSSSIVAVDVTAIANTGGNPVPSNNFIFNNDLYSPGTSNVTIVALEASGPAVILNVVKNNLGYGPAASAAVGLTNNGKETVSGNNSSNAQVKSTSPLFATTPPTPAIAGWVPQAGSYALGGGASVPVWENIRSALITTRNIGAV